MVLKNNRNILVLPMTFIAKARSVEYNEVLFNKHCYLIDRK